MPKFGLFAGNIEQPIQTYEGDRMVPRAGEYVDITVGAAPHQKVVATIRLAEGQCVKEIK